MIEKYVIKLLYFIIDIITPKNTVNKIARVMHLTNGMYLNMALQFRTSFIDRNEERLNYFYPSPSI